MRPRVVARIRLLKRWRNIGLIIGRGQRADAPYPWNLKMVTSCSRGKYPKILRSRLGRSRLILKCRKFRKGYFSVPKIDDFYLKVKN